MLTFKYAKNCVWGDSKNTSIDMIVKFEEFEEELPFMATPNDVMEYGVDLFNRAVSGEFGEVAPFVAPIQPTIDFEPTPTTPVTP